MYDLTLHSKSFKNITKTAVDFNFDFKESLGSVLGNKKYLSVAWKEKSNELKKRCLHCM